MEDNSKVHRTQIIIAIIGLVGVLGGAFLANWDKIFQSTTSQQHTPEPDINGWHTDNSQYTVSVYYLPGRESDAARVIRTLEGRGYIVNREPAYEDLKRKVKGLSYIYFKDKDFEAMTKLRNLLSHTLSEEFNVYRASQDRPNKEMRVVLSVPDVGGRLTGNSQYIVSVHYFPGRENDAARVIKILEGQGYIVNRQLASQDLQKKVKGLSYIYFKDKDFEAMTKIRSLLSSTLTEEFNVYRASQDRPDKEMRVVLSQKK